MITLEHFKQFFSVLGLLLLAGNLQAQTKSGPELEYFVKLTDASGYELVLDKKPQAVVSLSLASDELLSELAAPGQIRALTVFADDPEVSNIPDFAKTQAHKVSGEKEQVLVLKPDLVIVASWKEKEFVDSLRALGLKIYVLKAPESFADLRKAISDLSRLLGEEARGARLQKNLDDRLKAVEVLYKNIDPDKRPRVLYYSSYGSTYAAGTSFNALLEAAGLRNAAALKGLKGWPQLSKESLLSMNPDYIILPSWSYDPNQSAESFYEQFLKDPVFRHLTAVQKKQVFMLPDTHLQSNSQFMVAGVEDLARMVYAAGHL